MTTRLVRRVLIFGARRAVTLSESSVRRAARGLTANPPKSVHGLLGRKKQLNRFIGHKKQSFGTTQHLLTASQRINMPVLISEIDLLLLKKLTNILILPNPPL